MSKTKAMRYFPKTNLALFLPTLSSIICLSEVNKATGLFSPLASFSTSQCGSESCSVVSDSLRPYGLYSLRNSSGQNTGVGSFPTQGSNPGLPHCRRILYQLSHQYGSKGEAFSLPRCLEKTIFEDYVPF